jgi:MFS family permease
LCGLPLEVLTVLVMVFFSNVAYWQLGPFFPKYLRQNHIDEAYLGYVMSVFAGSFIISSLITGKFLLKYMERINGCFLGAAFTVSTIDL